MIIRDAKIGSARLFIARGDAARDEGRFRDAATLYGEALQLTPSRGDIHLQAGHMFKEAGELAQAELHYLAAARFRPNDAEVALQLGHFYKISGRLEEAAAAYAKVVELAPGTMLAERELDGLKQTGWRTRKPIAVAPREQPLLTPEDLDGEGRPDDLKLASLYGSLAPELMPRPLRELMRYSEESLALRQFGVHQGTFWGQKRVARGVEAIRGVVVSKTPLLEVEARVNGLPIHRGPLKGPYELEYEPDKSRIHKYVFNIWSDFSSFAPGLYRLELLFRSAGEPARVLAEEFVVEPPLLEENHPESDGVINLAMDATEPIEEQINSRPSIIHEAARASQLGDVRNVLVTRSDQLGDLVASIPGILRLRELLPDARLVGIFGPANFELAQTLNVFDEIIVINHAESWHERTRTLPLEEQEKLRQQLAPYKFDVAIDLSQSLMSRPLLALSGARFTYGFKDPNWGRLTSSFDDAFFDAKNRRETATHSKRILSLIERLGTLIRETTRIIRRDDLTRDRLAAYGIQENDSYAALHTGARIVWSRWAHYLELASRLLKETKLKVVLFTGDADLKNNLPPDLAESERFIILDRQLPFDDFDALLSFCSVYVGNDSGPKHLASLRGVPVVSIHSARINWSEWGQEHTGVIVSRKVPCAGCHIYHDPEECGKDFVCVKAIGLQEVYDAVRRYV